MGFGNLGVALGAATQEWNNQRKMDREDEILAMQKAAEARQAEQFGWQRDDQKRKTKIQTDQDAIMEEARQHAGYLQQLQNTPDDQLGTFAQGIISKYNQHPAYANGMFANMTTVDGKPVIVHGNMAQLGGVQTIPVTREHMTQALGQLGDDLRRRIALTSPEGYSAYADKQETVGLERDKLGIHRQEVADKGAYQRGILDWHAKQADRPQFMQDGTGRILAISPDGKLVGTYGSPRPITGGSGGGMNLTDEQAGMLNQAMQYEEVAKQLAKTNPSAAQVYRNHAVSTLDGLPAKVQLAFRGKFGNAPQDIDPWDMPVKVKRADPKTGAEFEEQVPRKLAFPDEYAKYVRESRFSQAMPEEGASFFGGPGSAAAQPQGRGLIRGAPAAGSFADRAARGVNSTLKPGEVAGLWDYIKAGVGNQ